MDLGTFKERITDLIRDLIKHEYKPEDISWLFNSELVKTCDIQYRLNNPLVSTREESVTDEPDGDSVHDPAITKRELDLELEQYMSHKYTCLCYKSDNDCPICLENMCDTQPGCCESWYHEKCLRDHFYRNETCPTCRQGLMLDEEGNVVKEIKKVEKVEKKMENINRSWINQNNRSPRLDDTRWINRNNNQSRDDMIEEAPRHRPVIRLDEFFNPNNVIFEGTTNRSIPATYWDKSEDNNHNNRSDTLFRYDGSPDNNSNNNSNNNNSNNNVEYNENAHRCEYINGFGETCIRPTVGNSWYCADHLDEITQDDY